MPEPPLTNTDATPIAVVGIGCRFPGGVRDLDSFGAVLTSGTTVFRKVPVTRWDQHFCDPARARPGTVASHVGGFLDEIDRFDAAYFGISPREASVMDPQQRLVLEVAWEAMSDSGRPLDAWRGTHTSTFLGMFASDYMTLHTKMLGIEGIGPHYASGNEFSFAGGRLAHIFDLRGPTAALTSACSSSLFAVHLAIQSLRSGECDIALAGGVSLMITPELSVFLSRIGAISPTGRCRPFAADADGILRSEGCALVVLKRLPDALADADRIYAVIRASVANHDGRGLGITAPNGIAQAALLSSALTKAGIHAPEIDYVEAHGTGTPLGDQIELMALDQVYGSPRPAGQPLFVGSGKAVFGHTDAAAGVAGLLKGIWVINAREVPAQPDPGRLTSAVDWDRRKLAVPLSTTSLQVTGRPVRVGVSSSGLSGTNVHVIAEGAEPAKTGSSSRPDAPYVLLTSAFHQAGLAEQITSMRELVTAERDALGDVIASAATRRTHERHRYAAVTVGPDELMAALDDPQEPPEGAYVGVVDPEGAPALAFVYSGQGTQWPGMAVDLYESSQAAKETLDECDALIRRDGQWSLVDELRRISDSQLDRTDIAQPAIFAVQLAVTRWLAECGIRPEAVVGHSVGEIAAAHVAGALSLPDAVRLAFLRGQILQETAGRGAMLAVRAGQETVMEVIRGTDPPVAIAAVNGPESVTLSGPGDGIDSAAAALEGRGLRCKRLPVDYAFHSPVVAACGPRLRAAIADLTARSPSVRLVSSVLPDDPDVLLDACYWERNLTDPVLLWPAIDRLLAERDQAIVEIGPHPVLARPLADVARRQHRRGPVTGTLRRGEPGMLALYKTVAQLYVCGIDVDWTKITGLPARYRTLPVPSWGGDRYWLPGVEPGEQGRGPAGAAPPAQVRLSLLDRDGRVISEMVARPADDAAPAGSSALPETTVAAAGMAATPLPARHARNDGGLVRRVEEHVRAVLGIASDQPLPRRRGLFELGLDSITAVELRDRLRPEFGLELAATFVFENPTIEALTAFLAEAVPETGFQEPQEAVAQPVTPAGITVAGDGPRDDAVAVVGIACRLPGASSPEQFWALLADGRHAIRDLPASRRADPIWAEAGPGVPTRGGYLDEVEGFDAEFFRVSPREAKSLDPQHRLLLEVAWEALEDAGQPAHALHGQAAGVYFGLNTADYQQLLTRDMADLDYFYGTGTTFAGAAGRLSYFLGLSGPSIAVDTACSSSLTAVHLACQGLRQGDCEIAIAGGVNVIVAPTVAISMSGASAMAPDGLCKTFGDTADGYGRGEGAAALILKPLGAAMRDGDRVYAVIRGTAVNQDGATGGLTVPNGSAQVAVIRRAIAAAGWAPRDVDYVEAHGTGTLLGDPIEVRALAEALGPGRSADEALLIGSAKANIGHLEAAAGVAGLLKVILALHHRELPPHPLDRPSTHIDWDRLPVTVVTERRQWPRRDHPRRAGVSSFGFTGSNAHVVVEQPPEVPEPTAVAPRQAPPYVLMVTAAAESALCQAAGRLAARLREAPAELDDIVFTAAYRRTWLSHRLAVTGQDAAAIAEALELAAGGNTTSAVRKGQVPDDVRRTVGFWYGAEPPSASLRSRLAEVPEYASALRSCAERLTVLTGATFDPFAGPPEELLAAYLLCHHVAATRLWATVGLAPEAVIGEGAGQLGAAWATGRLDLADALRLAAGQVSGISLPEELGTEISAVGVDAVVDVLLNDLPGPLAGQTGVQAGADDPLDRLASTAAELFVTGAVPAPAKALRRPASLPGYPWQRRRHWYREATGSDRPAIPWVLSAFSHTGLRARAAALRDFTAESQELSALDVGCSLAALPRSGAQRGVVLANHAGDFRDGLAALADGRTAVNLTRGAAGSEPKIAFVFPGQGGQWREMAVELMTAEPAFAERMRACGEALAEFTDWSLSAVIGGEPGAPRLNRADVVQPVLFAVMVSLAELWRSYGVKPAAVIGHSQGEIAAAHIAGALSLRDAARVVALRSAEMMPLARQGGMAAVALNADAASHLLRPFHGRLSIAAVNGPNSVVISGDVGALAELADTYQGDGVRFQRVATAHAGHSPQMEQIGERIERVLAGITPRSGNVPFYSSVTGEPLDTAELGPRYWYRNLRQCVLFEKTIRALLTDGHDLFIEVSPHPLLTAAIDETAEQAGSNARTLGTLRKNDGGTGRFLTSLAEAYVHGASVDWQPIFAGRGARPAAIPDVTGHELDAWRYRVDWRPTADPGEPRLSGTWLILAPGTSPGREWAAAAQSALAEWGADARQLVLDPTRDGRGHITSLLRNEAGGGLAGVLSMLAMDERPHHEFPDVSAGLAATLALVQALGDVGPDIPMWLTTTGAVCADGAGGDLESPGQAQAWGMGRVAGLEHPQRWGGLIDLPRSPGEETLGRLCGALGGGLGMEDQIAVRDSGVYVRRLVRDPVSGRPVARNWQPGGSVLVTGGTGSLGRRLARWLAASGAEHVILASRRGRTAPGAAGLEAELARSGTPVTIAACDVADRAALDSLLREARSAGRPVRTVIHAAVVPEPGPLSGTTLTQLANTLRAKVTGARILDELLSEDSAESVDAFVLFSSVAGVWGAADNGVFAAADAYLDALATQRRARGQAGTTIAWSIWNAFGEEADDPVARDTLTRQSERQGLPLLDPAQALRALRQVLDFGETSVVVADVEWERFASLYTSARPRPLLDELPDVQGVASGAPGHGEDEAGETALAQMLARLPESERDWAVLDLVRTEAAAVLGYKRANDVDPDRPFTELGSDSVTAVELRTRLNEATGLRLPASLAFDYPTAAAIAGYLLELGLGEPAVPAAEPTLAAEYGNMPAVGEPMAIVGMACRLPGGVVSPEGLWRLVAEGRDAVSGFPVDRGWDLAGLFDPDPDHLGTSYTREGGFLDQAAEFDAEFFGISPREALAMDPRQRLLLETCWELFEHAGVDPTSLKGSRTGVFVGATPTDYVTGAPQVPQSVEGYSVTGSTPAVLSGRVSYVFGLEGPAVTVDTACSSSSVALHLACQALRAGECTMAVAGGAAVTSSPKVYIDISRQRGLSPDGRCKAFAEAADGTGFSEGVGLLLVEPLPEARRRGHEVFALIRGSALNQDGASNGLTAPSGPSQQRVIRAALANAGVAAADVDVVEAHGTGTALGDPIEAQALLATYGQGRPAGRPVLLGSVKSNIGHTQATSGVAGVMKMVLAMRHGVVPATLHVDEPSRNVDWSAGDVRLAVEAMPWPDGGHPRRAGVSSFGISGTNAHIILEQPPEQQQEQRDDAAPDPASAQAAPPALWPVSAASPASLRQQATRLRQMLADEPRPRPRDIGWSLASSRAALPHRAVLLGPDRDDYIRQLTMLADGEPDPRLVCSTAQRKPRVVFMFPGQGGQWPGMAAELLDTCPQFAGHIRECEQALAPYINWSLTEVIRRSDRAPSLDRIDVVQPALFAVMVSLAGLWRHYGVHPAAVVGHSQGEVAAAYVAGALSLDDAARVVAVRAAELSQLAISGRMVSLQVGEQKAAELLARWQGRLTIGAVNSPSQVTVAGDADALNELTAECRRLQIRILWIPSAVAGHSWQVEPLRDSVLAKLDGIAPQRARMPFYSSVTGEPVDTSGLDAQYWYRNLREPVQFERTTRRLFDDGFDMFIEPSPHPMLTAAVLGTAMSAEDAAEPVTVGSLRRSEGGMARFAAALAEAWVNGADLDWARLIPGSRRVSLPTYAFDRQRFWMDDQRAAVNPAALGVAAPDHPLLGAAVELADSGGLVLTGRLSVGTQPWLADHAVNGVSLLPGTGFAELALRAGAEAGCPRIEEITLEAPLLLSGDDPVCVQLIVGPPDDSGHRPLAIFSRPDAADSEPGDWTRHASAVLTADSHTAPPLAAWPPPGAEPVPLDPDAFYAAGAEAGYTYGPSFRGLTRAWRCGDEVYAEVSLPAQVRDEAGRYGVHPALFDAALHAMVLVPSTTQGNGHNMTVRLPFSLAGVSLFASGARALRVRISPAGSDAIAVTAASEAGDPVVLIERLVTRPFAAEQLSVAANPANRSLFQLDWVPSPMPKARIGDGWAILGETVLGQDGPDLAAGLLSSGISTHSYPDVAALLSALADGAPCPRIAVLPCVPVTGAGLPGSAFDLASTMLRDVQAWLADDRTAQALLVVVTRLAVAAGNPGDVHDLAAASVWGLLRSAQAEHPGRIILADLDEQDGASALAQALASDEPQIAIRRGAALIPRLAVKREEAGGKPRHGLAQPLGGRWRLEPDRSGVLDAMSLVARPETGEPLAPGQARVRVRAAGLNFYDLMVALGIFPGADLSIGGGEGAGVIQATGPDVTGLKPGDRVMGLMRGAFGTETVTDYRWLAPIPQDWSFEQAASVPSAFLTAYFALIKKAGLRTGQRVMVHAGAGGVGTAAVQIARHLGAEVFATASPAKHDALRRMGLDDAHIASSRDPEFVGQVLAVTGGAGVDVVVNSLAGELIDASLRLLPNGGHFIELGKTDIRDPRQVAGAYPGVVYQPVDLVPDTSPELIQAMLADIIRLLRDGAVRPLPVRTWDVRDAPEAFRYMAQARHVGKLVLTIPPAPDPGGTVLITGGTGTLGGFVAKHLAGPWGMRHILLASRQGAAAPGAEELSAELARLGADVRLAACDVADREALADLLASVPAEHPLTAVVHTAAVLDDVVFTSLTSERLATVLRPKADAAVHLDQLTSDLDLGMFVLYSSAAGLLGNPGQANYGAANVLVDTLAAARRSRGQAATSIAWGPWAPESTWTGQLDRQDRDRIARTGAKAMSVEEGLALFDQGVHAGDPLVVAAHIDRGALRAQDSQGSLPVVLRLLVPRGSRPVPSAGEDSASGGLGGQFSGMPAAERRQTLVNLVRKNAAAVLGHGSVAALETDRGFLDMGFDSLTAIELRNRLAAATGLRLPATLIFDCPTPAVLARELNERISPVSEVPDTANGGDDGHRRLSDDEISAVDAMDVDELIRAVHSANGHERNS